MKKRDDLQGIRGIAIILVVIFHLKPSYFPLGFIGVDMFFVLSGYLMTAILSKKEFNWTTIHEFYLRRFKRIVPLFILIIMIVYGVGALILIQIDKHQLLLDIGWSITFFSNVQPMWEWRTYWEQVRSYRLLVHCWSLGVEIQFYFIAPLLLCYFKQKCRVTLYLVMLGSFLLQLFAPYKISYGLLFCRIWQFQCGMVAFDMINRMNKTDEKSDPEKVKVEKEVETNSNFVFLRQFISTISIAVIVAATIVNSEFVDHNIMRIFGTVLTAICISLSLSDKYSLLTLKPLNYIGDISYTLYLVHWPTIVFYKYFYNIKSLDIKDCNQCIFIMLLLTIIISHTIEKLLTTVHVLYGLVLSIICILLLAATFIFYNADFPLLLTPGEPVQINKDLRTALDFNMRETDKGYFAIPCDPDKVTESWTEYIEEPAMRCQTTGNGSLNILVLGNSIAYRAYPLIHDILKGRYQTLRLFSRSGCPPLSDECPDFTKAARIVVEKTKPDIIFNMWAAAGWRLPKFTKPVKDLETDYVYLQFQKNLDFYSNHSRHIVLDTPYYNSDTKASYEIVKRIRQGLPLDDLKVTKEVNTRNQQLRRHLLESDAQQHWHQERVLRLKCNKCEVNKLDEALFNSEGIFYYYDRKSLQATIGDGLHFTPVGLELLRPKYTEIVERLINKLSV